MSNFQANQRPQSIFRRIIPLAVILCLAASGMGARLAMSTAAIPENESCQEEVGSDTVVRIVSPRRSRQGNERDATADIIKYRLAAESLRHPDTMPTSLQATARICLIGAGIKLLR